MSKWPEMPLTNIARITRGSEPGSASYIDSKRGIPFLRVGDVTGKTDNAVFTNSDNVVLVTDSDLLLTLDGSPGYVRTGLQGAISSGIRKVETIDPKKVSLSWLRFCLQSHEVQETIQRHTTGITILHAASAVSHIQIPVPPLKEQERIVGILDEAETLLQIRKKIDHRLANINKILFEKFVLTKSKSWKKVHLDELCIRIEDCPHSTPQYSKNKTEYPCLRSSDIQEGIFDWSTTKYVDEYEYKDRVKRIIPQPGDIVYCREGARLGNAAIIPNDLKPCLGQRMMLFRANPNVATPEIIWAFLNSNLIEQQVTSLVGGAASPHLNVRDIKAFSVFIPPMNLQQEFTSQIEDIRILQNSQSISKMRLDDLFKSLLHRAFQGEL
jgi:type I restriction enzyme S subunit